MINDHDSVLDPYCKANSMKSITRKTCKNNCRFYNHEKKECRRGHLKKVIK